MIDLHYHLLPGIDDGAANLAEAFALARLSLAEGVNYIACTPHIFPGLYNNVGDDILRRIEWLQGEFAAEGIACRLVSGSDAHIEPGIVGHLRSGRTLTLNGGRYVLIEPPHHVPPPRMDRLFFDLLAAGYVPILTHPERMSWADRDYELIERLVRSGAWTQVTAAALVGDFGVKAKRRAERLLRDGLVHFVASDAHDPLNRPPAMASAYLALRTLVGEAEAVNLVEARPMAVLENRPPGAVPLATRPGAVSQADADHPGRFSAAYLGRFSRMIRG